MQGRYKIIRRYYGLFDSKDVICVTDSLFEAVRLCEDLAKVYDDCLYDFDFKKTVSDVCEGYDFDGAFVISCRNLKEYYERKKERLDAEGGAE